MTVRTTAAAANPAPAALDAVDFELDARGGLEGVAMPLRFCWETFPAVGPNGRSVSAPLSGSAPNSAGKSSPLRSGTDVFEVAQHVPKPGSITRLCEAAL